MDEWTDERLDGQWTNRDESTREGKKWGGGGRTLRENGYIPFDEQLVEGTRFFRIFANDFW